MSARRPILDVAPPERSLFRPVGDRYGLRLALVFGNQARGGICPFYKRDRCWHCDIGAGEGRAFDTDANRRRLEWLKERYASCWSEVSHLVLFNSGSTLSPRELDPGFLREVVAWAATLPRLRELSLDSRETWIRTANLQPLAEVAGALRLRPILGMESADDTVRNTFLQKAMSRRSINRAFREIAKVPGPHGLDANLLIAGPGTQEEGPVRDALGSARFLWRLAQRHGLALDLNLEPYYPSLRSSGHYPDHPRCSLVTLAHVVLALSEWSRVNTGGQVGIFVGLQDEEHDQDPESRAAMLRLREALDRFNASGEVGGVRRILAGHGEQGTT